MSLAFRSDPSPSSGRAAARAVFLHSAWRSAGTWIWNEFRARPQTMAFYEPLHEELGGLTLDHIGDTNTGSWDSGHPQTAPYFLEFAPLLQRSRKGVAGFERAFSFDHYFLEDEAPQPRLRAYLERLHNVAQLSGRQPVFKFCRSLGRTGWMRTQFPDAAHIAILRDPLAQWESAWRLAATQTPYFLAMPVAILAANPSVALVQAVTTAFDLKLDHLRASQFKATYARAESFAQSASVEMTYRCALAFWLVTALSSVAHAEIVIDSDRLSESLDYRTSLQSELLERTGVAVDFTSARASRRSSTPIITASEIDRLHQISASVARAFDAPGVLYDKLKGNTTRTLERGRP